MGYKRLLFMASKWLDQVNDDGTRVIESVNDGTDATCRVVCIPIPGSEPPQVTYSCVPRAGCNECELKSQQTPGGAIVYWCECVSEAGGLKAEKTAKAGSAKSKAKAKAKSKAKRKK